jgi:hypothetical protein
MNGHPYADPQWDSCALITIDTQRDTLDGGPSRFQPPQMFSRLTGSSLWLMSLAGPAELNLVSGGFFALIIRPLFRN